MYGPRGAELYRATVPRIIPTNAVCVSSDAGTGDDTATGRSWFVDSHRLSVAVHLLDNGRNQPQAHRLDVRRILAIEGLDRDWIKAAVLALGTRNRRD